VMWLLGMTHAELGGSAAERLGGRFCGPAPQSEVESFAQGYAAFAAVRDAGWVRSADVCARGGLGLALARAVLASDHGLRIALPRLESLGAYGWLFSESTGRILFTTAPEQAKAVEKALGAHGLLRLGDVGPRGSDLLVSYGDEVVLGRSPAALRDHYRGAL
jgi:phosphoribosylformylglycinamidine synthase subunit PurSL